MSPHTAAPRIGTAGASAPSTDQVVERLGRVAIATQGVVYGIVGLLAVQVAQGDDQSEAEASQRGAIESVARQPFGKGLLIVLAVGLAAHGAWRLSLAIRGERGDDEDGKSVALRVANAARTVLYAGLTLAAVRALTSGGSTGGSGGSSSEQRSTATVLEWPGGRWIVIAAGLGVIGAGLWNGKRAVTRSFADSLDLSRLPERRRRLVRGLGVAGYLARGVVFALVGWFLVTAGLQHDPEETKGLDGALRELVATGYGPILLLVLALGMVAFGAYRFVDAFLRKASEITHA